MLSGIVLSLLVPTIVVESACGQVATGQDQQCQWGLARLLQLLYGGSAEAEASADRRKNLKKRFTEKKHQKQIQDAHASMWPGVPVALV